MPVYICDVCPHEEHDRGCNCGCAAGTSDKPSSERNMDHMLDEHRRYVVEFKARGLPPSAMGAA